MADAVETLGTTLQELVRRLFEIEKEDPGNSDIAHELSTHVSEIAQQYTQFVVSYAHRLPEIQQQTASILRQLYAFWEGNSFKSLQNVQFSEAIPWMRLKDKVLFAIRTTQAIRNALSQQAESFQELHTAIFELRGQLVTNEEDIPKFATVDREVAVPLTDMLRHAMTGLLAIETYIGPEQHERTQFREGEGLLADIQKHPGYPSIKDILQPADGVVRSFGKLIESTAYLSGKVRSELERQDGILKAADRDVQLELDNDYLRNTLYGYLPVADALNTLEELPGPLTKLLNEGASRLRSAITEREQNQADDLARAHEVYSAALEVAQREKVDGTLLFLNDGRNPSLGGVLEEFRNDLAGFASPEEGRANTRSDTELRELIVEITPPQELAPFNYWMADNTLSVEPHASAIEGDQSRFASAEREYLLEQATRIAEALSGNSASPQLRGAFTSIAVKLADVNKILLLGQEYLTAQEIFYAETESLMDPLVAELRMHLRGLERYMNRFADWREFIHSGVDVLATTVDERELSSIPIELADRLSDIPIVEPEVLKSLEEVGGWPSAHGQSRGARILGIARSISNLASAVVLWIGKGVADGFKRQLGMAIVTALTPTALFVLDKITGLGWLSPAIAAVKTLLGL
ncbi:uncharacterized protein YukE [Rhizobium sp. BK196]|uniref:hypothetical protein n=1 Tax=Rhizobium sp. BK196 TaxID=2587073 RepID=UPI00161D2144|nr:hypothetical protein [Rhizobium sp. BK196]MBB3308564.1 uncharacterized protein YukE [Rhizobium sp. BK196]